MFEVVVPGAGVEGVGLLVVVGAAALFDRVFE